MSNDERVKKLDERIDVTLEYVDTLTKRKGIKPDTTKLKKLAKEIRKNLEDYPFEATVHPHTSN